MGRETPKHEFLQLSPRIRVHAPESAVGEMPGDGISLPQLPGPAFGDGTHPTTRLCAGAVDFLCRTRRMAQVLDVGTGTGILARIARARGADFVVATEIDRVALVAARLNCELDRHKVLIQVTGSPPQTWGPRFDLVIANILEATLIELAPALSAALAPDGILLLSGFTKLQIPALRIPFESLGLTYGDEFQMEEWCLLLFRRDPVPNVS